MQGRIFWAMENKKQPQVRQNFNGDKFNQRANDRY